MHKLHEWVRVCVDLDSTTSRMAVPGGWLYRVRTIIRIGENVTSQVTVTFVPEKT